jgi:hypothetical protein
MTEPAACPGPCNSPWRRAQALHTDATARWRQALTAWETGGGAGNRPLPPDPPALRAWCGEPVWCGRCAAAIHRQLAELDDLICLLTGVPDLRSAVGDRAGRVSGTPGRPSPSPAADTASELNGWLRDWESAVTGGDPPAQRGWLASETTTLIRSLVARFGQVITSPDWASDFGLETRRWHRELTARAKAGSGVHHKGRPCPRCRLYSLWWEEGDDYIRCQNLDCNRVILITEYDELTAESVMITRTGRRHPVP